MKSTMLYSHKLWLHVFLRVISGFSCKQSGKQTYAEAPLLAESLKVLEEKHKLQKECQEKEQNKTKQIPEL